MSITVYTQPSCMQCNATYRALKNQGLNYQSVDLSQDPDALAFVRGLGYTAAPIVVAGDEHWSGFRPDRIKGLGAMAASA